MNKSFTLIEILVVIVVIGIISSFIIVGLSSVSDKANIAKSKAFSNSIRNSLLMNLVSEWKFDDLSAATNGTTIIDSWGANSGTLLSNDTDDKLRIESQCISGKCLNFDGTGDYISFNASDSLIINKSLTVEFWIKQTRDAQAVQYIVSNDRDMSPPVGGYDVYITNTWLLYSCMWRKSTGTKACTSGGSISENMWYYIIVNFDGQSLKVYKNGILSGNTSIIDEIENPSQNFTIGCLAYNRPSYYRFNGLVDDVRIYNQAIPTSEIQQNYYSGINKLFKNKGIVLNEFNQRLTELKSNLTIYE
jgi:prepilin-type N-terminal cleavage/methylation domain-containing protein